MLDGAASEGGSGYEENLQSTGLQQVAVNSYQHITGMENQIQQHHVRRVTPRHSFARTSVVVAMKTPINLIIISALLASLSTASSSLHSEGCSMQLCMTVSGSFAPRKKENPDVSEKISSPFLCCVSHASTHCAAHPFCVRALT
eukprot:jgi/Botrbrau1/21507/Bobra.174_2s0014.2